IYYTATSQEINAYEKKYFDGGDEFRDCHGSTATKFPDYAWGCLDSSLTTVPLKIWEPEGSTPVSSPRAAKRNQGAIDRTVGYPHMADEDKAPEEPLNQDTTMRLLRGLKEEIKQDLRDVLRQSQDQLCSRQERSQSYLNRQHELQMQTLTARLEELQDQICEQKESMDTFRERMLEQIIALLTVKPAGA
ncbi:hypothetical protein BGZ75_009728, partial [Mortierella antarctica]